MKKLRNSGVVTLSLLAAMLGSGARASAQVGAKLTEVICNGLACGGSGGSLGREFVYEVHPNGNSITRLDVGVEDGDLSHYVHGANDVPPNWNVSIVSVARSHDIEPTEHGVVTGKAGTCPYVLRFSSATAKTSTFQVGFDYFQPGARVHDVMWKTSDNRQTNWTFESGEGGGPVHSPLRLNVLLIVLDDVGTDKLALFDTPHAPTNPPEEFAKIPKLEALAADGIQFTNFYVNPLCSTTRACIQTGRYSHRHGIGALVQPLDVFALDDCEVTLGELLKLGFTSSGAAYRTGAFGKWHLAPSSFSFADHAIRNGYDRFYGTYGNSPHFLNWTKIEANNSPTGPVVSEVQVPGPLWTADVVRIDATQWIRDAVEPFFAYVAFNPPHSLYEPPPFSTSDDPHRDLLSLETKNKIDEIKATNPNGPYDADEKEFFYRAMIEAVDSEIDYLLADMDPAKRAKTMVIVVSDNGTPGAVVRAPHDPDHAKGFIYQLGVRVPMIVSGPLASHGVCDAVVGAVDLFDTIAAITGADPDVVAPGACSSPARDSESFLPLIENPSASTTRLAFCQNFEPNGAVEAPAAFACLTKHGRALTDGHYKYIRRLRFAAPPPGTPPCDPCTDFCGRYYEEEFYDLWADPEETMDLAASHPGLEGIYGFLKSYMDAHFEF